MLPFVFPFEKPLHIRHVVENITLLRLTGFDRVIAVAWTLSHEIIFYSVFLVVVLSRTVGLATAASWIAICAYRLMTGEPPPVPYALSSFTGIDYGAFTNLIALVSEPINSLFLFGVLAFYLYKKLIATSYRDAVSFGASLLGLAGFAAAGGSWFTEGRYVNWGGYNAAFGFASFFLILGSASTRINAWACSKTTLLFFGNASYAIYLAHYGIQKALVNLLPVSLGPTSLFALISILSLFGGILLHLGIEKPLLKYFGRTQSLRLYAVSSGN